MSGINVPRYTLVSTETNVLSRIPSFRADLYREIQFVKSAFRRRSKGIFDGVKHEEGSSMLLQEIGNWRKVICRYLGFASVQLRYVIYFIRRTRASKRV